MKKWNLGFKVIVICLILVSFLSMTACVRPTPTGAAPTNTPTTSSGGTPGVPYPIPQNTTVPGIPYPLPGGAVTTPTGALPYPAP